MSDNTTAVVDLATLSDPYRSMAYWARDIADGLESYGHSEQAASARELFTWLVEQGTPP